MADDARGGLRSRASLRIVLWLLPVAALVVTLVGWHNARQATVQAEHARFGAAAQTVLQRLYGHLSSVEQMLRAARSLHVAGRAPTQAEWAKFLATLHLDLQTPGLRSIGVVEQVAAEALDVHTHAMARTAGPGYRVWPDSGRAVRYPITLIWPLNEMNARTIGFDVYSEATRAADSSSPRSGRTICCAPHSQSRRQRSPCGSGRRRPVPPGTSCSRTPGASRVRKAITCGCPATWPSGASRCTSNSPRAKRS